MTNYINKIFKHLNKVLYKNKNAIIKTRFATANLNVSAAAIFPVPENSKNKMTCHTVALNF